MNKKTKLWLVAGAALLLVIGMVQYFGRTSSNINLPSVSVRNLPGAENITTSPAIDTNTEFITIDFGNGKKIAGEVATQSAYQALVEVAKTNKLEVASKEYKFGRMVEKVGDTGQSKSHFWMYSVNGKPGQIAADRYVIHPGDKVEWVYQKINQ